MNNVISIFHKTCMAHILCTQRKCVHFFDIIDLFITSIELFTVKYNQRLHSKSMYTCRIVIEIVTESRF